MVAVEADGKNMKRPRTGGLGIYIHQLFDDYTGANYEVEPEVPLLLLGTVCTAAYTVVFEQGSTEWS